MYGFKQKAFLTMMGDLDALFPEFFGGSLHCSTFLRNAFIGFQIPLDVCYFSPRP